MKFICAFNRDRDFYHVPAALSEGEILERLVTDCYFGEFGVSGWIGGRIGQGHRSHSALPRSLVQWSLLALGMQLEARLLKGESTALFKRLDVILSKQALALGRRTRSSYFLYSGYAKEAFEGMDWPGARLLFVFHPPASLSRELLEADFQRHPEVCHSYRLHIDEIEQSDSGRVEAELRAATGVVCASSFTKKSIERSACSSAVPVVVPYGCEIIGSVVNRLPGRIRLLFVGQGVQRKGLHHLLHVWRRLRHRGDCEIRVVSSKIDPWMAATMLELGIRPESGLSNSELNAAYDWADVFVMPSIFEGFGLVYLEALSRGCFVVGSVYSGLPDLLMPPNVGTMINPGALQELEKALVDAVEAVKSGVIEKRYIAEWSRAISWREFRRQVLDFANRNSAV